MKKTILFTALASLALASCTQDEPVSINQGSAISFRPAMGVQTRASETTNDNLSSFYVTALMGESPFFSNINYAKGSDGFFNSVSPYYWPGDDTELNFYAYAPSMDELGADVVISPDEKKLESFTVAENIADQVDFITANGTGKKSVNEAAGLELTFGHRLSQIEVRAKADNKNYIFKVAGVRIGRPQTTGTFDFTTNTWTLDDWHETAVYTSSCTPVTLTPNAVSIMGPSGNAMFIPQKLTPWSPTGDPDNVAREAYLSVYVQITTADGAQVYPFPSDNQIDPNTNQKRQYAWASIPIGDNWEAGKKYVYTLDFSRGAGNVDPDDPTPGKPVLGDPIKFTVNVLPWTEADMSKPMTALK